MKDGEKRWLKKKGCRNCAIQWCSLPHYEDCESDCDIEHGHWMIVPMIPGKYFSYLSETHLITKERFSMVNCYFTKTGRLRFNSQPMR